MKAKNVSAFLIFLAWIALSISFTGSAYPAAQDDYEEITYDAAFSKEDISFGKLEGYDTVNLPDCILTNEPGKPQLPIKVLIFAIDQDKEVCGVQVMTDVKCEIQGKFNIIPAQKDFRERDEYIFTLPDASAYDSSESYPKERVEIKSGGLMGGLNVVTVYVYPLEYIPKKKELILHTGIVVSLIQRPKSASIQAAYASQSHEPAVNIYARSDRSDKTMTNLLNKIIANPQDVKHKYKTSPSSTFAGFAEASAASIDYLIITNNELKNSAAFQPLIDDKIAKGLTVEVESVEDIQAGTAGRDLQEKIRNFIKDKYLHNGLVWVLLGGDTDVVPIRIIWKGYGNTEGDFYPCDLYYSDLDRDWDADGDGIFGEIPDNVDLYPDVFTGRAPVRNAVEAGVFANKVLTYQREIQNYSDKILLLGYNDFGDLGGLTKDYIAQEYLPYYFDIVTKYYERDIPAYANLTLDAISQGYHIINHNDHGSQYVIQTGADYIHVFDIEGLANSSRPAILYSTSCFAGLIDRDCFAEYWMRNPNGGGVAFIGMGRAGYAVASKAFDCEFFKCLLNDGIVHIGQAHASSKIPFIVQAGSNLFVRVTQFELNLLGDPEMIVRFWNKNAVITSPSNDSFIRGNVDINGSAVWEGHFDKYEIRYSPKNDPGNSTQIASSNMPVEDGILALWDTGVVPDGDYVLNVTVFAPGDTVIKTSSVNVNVDNVNQPPEFIGLTDKAMPAGRLSGFKIEACDLDDPDYWPGSLVYTADLRNLPGEASFDTATQMFSWFPSEQERGSYAVTFTVSDQCNPPVIRTIILTALYAEEIPIAVGPGSQDYPAIYKNNIAWQDSGQIYISAYDPSTGTVSPKVAIGNTGYTQRYPSVYEDKVVWEGYLNSGGDSNIYIYDPSANPEVFPVTTDTGNQNNPEIHGNVIVWKDFRNGNSDIYMRVYDPAAHTFGPEIPVITESHSQDSPAIYGDIIAWVDMRHDFNGDIYMRRYNSSTDTLGPEIPVAVAPGYQVSPAVYENKIVWSDRRSGNYDIYMRAYDPYTGELGPEVPVATGALDQLHPAIYGNRILWSENLDIYIFDLLTAEKIQLTNAVSWQYNPAVYQDKIVWRDNRNGNIDIYMARICYMPKIISIAPVSISPGQNVEITGSNFADFKPGVSTVLFAPDVTAIVQNERDWSDGRIVCAVPQDAKTGEVYVVTPAGRSNGVNVVIPPQITSLSNPNAEAGKYIFIKGNNFGARTASSYVEFSGAGGTMNAVLGPWSDTQIGVYVPNLPVGSYQVTVGDGTVRSNSAAFNLIVAPRVFITSPTHNSVVPYTGFNVTGTAIQGSSALQEVHIKVRDYDKKRYTVQDTIVSGTTEWSYFVSSDKMSPNDCLRLYVYAKDAEGNISFTKSVQVDVSME